MMAYSTSTRQRLISILTGVLLIIINVFAIYYFAFSLLESVIIIGVTLIMYIGLALFLAQDRAHRIQRVRVVERPIVRTIEKPVIKEVIVEKPVVKEIVRYVERKRKKLNIEKFEYIGSSVNKVYHTRNCRLGKLVKRKYKEHSHQPSFFIKRKYKPCHVCILKDKKI